MPSEAEVGIEPRGGITFTGPFRTEKKVGVRLSNPTDHRITFKMKSTRRHRFSMRPGFGFIEPYRQFCITLVCKPFDSGHLSKRDRFTILLAEAPGNTKEKRPSRIWKENTPSNVRRHVLPVTYAEKSTAAGQEDKVQPLKPTRKEEEKHGERKQDEARREAERKRREEEKKAEAERKQKEKEEEEIRREMQRRAEEERRRIEEKQRMEEQRKREEEERKRREEAKRLEAKKKLEVEEKSSEEDEEDSDEDEEDDDEESD